MKFNCEKCGLCCKAFNCSYLDQKTNLCTIYETRPNLCRIQKDEEWYSTVVNEKEWFKRNKIACELLKNMELKQMMKRNDKPFQS